MSTIKKIRQELKAIGYSNRKVGVREEFGGYSSAIYVTVKDDSVDVDKVKEIAYHAESVDRCEVTGEILAGGNTYVFVSKNNFLV